MQVTSDFIVDLVLRYHRDKVEEFVTSADTDYKVKADAAIEIISRIVAATEKPDPDTQKKVRRKIRERVEAIYGTAMLKDILKDA